MARDEVRQESLTVYLAKPGLEGVNDTIKLPERLAQFLIADDTGSLGTLTLSGAALTRHDGDASSCLKWT